MPDIGLVGIVYSDFEKIDIFWVQEINLHFYAISFSILSFIFLVFQIDTQPDFSCFLNDYYVKLNQNHVKR